MKLLFNKKPVPKNENGNDIQEIQVMDKDGNMLAVEKWRHNTFQKVGVSKPSKFVKENFVLGRFIDDDLTKEEYQMDAGNLVVTMEEPLPEISTMRIFYTMCNPKDGAFFFCNREGEHFFYTRGGVKGAHLWMPCLDNSNTLSQFRFEITTAKDLYTICTGDLQSQIQTELTRTSVYIQRRAIPPSAVCLIVGPFEVFPKGFPRTQEVQVSSFFPRSFMLKSEGEKVEHDVLEREHALRKILLCVEHIISFLDKVFDIPYAQIFSNQFKIVFLGETYSNRPDVYCSVGILPLEMLVHRRVIEGSVETWCSICYSLVRQYFGCLLLQKKWEDTWLIYGLAGYVTQLFRKAKFGKNSLKYYVYEQLQKLRVLERREHALYPTGGIFRKEELMGEFVRTKAPLVMYCISNTIGEDSLNHLLEKKVKAAAYSSSYVGVSRKDEWDFSTFSVRELRTRVFMNKLKKSFSFDAKSFARNWIYGKGGILTLLAGFEFDPARNLVKIAVKQVLPRPDVKMYTGNVDFVIHETSQPEKWTHRITKELNFFEIQVSTKASMKKKKAPKKKKKIAQVVPQPVLNQNKGQQQKKTPIRWIRVDPEFKLLRSVKFKLPFHMLLLQARHDKEVMSQTESIETLETEYSQDPKSVILMLMEYALSTSTFWKIRVQALKAVGRLLEKHPKDKSANWATTRVMEYFKGRYFDHSGEHVIHNNFTEMEEYHVKKQLVKTISKLKDPETGQTLWASLKVLMDLIEQNDNSKNAFSDVYYEGVLLRALGNVNVETKRKDMLDPGGMKLTKRKKENKVDGDSPPDRGFEFYMKCVEIIHTKLTVEDLMPSFNYELSKSAMKAFAKLIINDKVPFDLSIFFDRIRDRKYPIRVRIYAQNCLIKIFSRVQARTIFEEVNIDSSMDKEEDNRGQAYLGFQNLVNIVLNVVEDDSECSYLKFIFVKNLQREIEKKAAVIQDDFEKSNFADNELVISEDTSPMCKFFYKVRSPEVENITFVARLWFLIRNERIDQRLRVVLMEFWVVLYGYKNAPNCVTKRKTFIKTMDTIPEMEDIY